MRGVNYMIFSPETMAEIVDDYVKEKMGLKNVKVESFSQRKHHNSRYFEAKLVDEGTDTN